MDRREAIIAAAATVAGSKLVTATDVIDLNKTQPEIEGKFLMVVKWPPESIGSVPELTQVVKAVCEKTGLTAIVVPHEIDIQVIDIS